MLAQPIGHKDNLSGAKVDDTTFKGHESFRVAGVHKAVERGDYRHPADQPGQGAIDIGTKEMRLDNINFVLADDMDQ